MIMALTNDLWKMNQAITIRRLTGYTDQSGGRPYAGGSEDFIVNVPAEVQNPDIADIVMGPDTQEVITHRIRMRYHPLVKQGMVVVWNDSGTWRNAKIKKVDDPGLQHLYSILICAEYAWSEV